MTPSEKPTFTVDLQPIGRRADVPPENTILQAAQSSGIEMASLCGGEGWCGKCRIRLVKGSLTPFSDAELEVLTEEERQTGTRLACQAKPLSGGTIDILPESLTATQRLQVEGEDLEAESFTPPITPLDIRLTPPSLNDLQSDWTRLEQTLLSQGITPLEVGLSALSELSEKLRAQNWEARLVLYERTLVTVLNPHAALLGLALDIGTTKIAAYLVNLETRVTLAKGGVTNPQVAYGEDVVSRIAYANEHKDGRRILQTRLVERINALTQELCAQISASPEQIVAATAVGNTVMHHSFIGLPLRQLGEAPYIPVVSAAIEAPARDVGLHIAAGADVYMPPNIAGYVGADHVAMLLATNVIEKSKTVVALDIGTNTEISLYTPRGGNDQAPFHGRLLSCSCASGPAFEGAHIHDGMRAVAGAIERVQIRDGLIYTQTIENQPPIGLCGSGILDAVAELVRVGILDTAGRLQKNHPGVRPAKGGGEFALTIAAKSGHGREVIVNRRDVNEIQLAKGAIRAGVDVLLNLMEIDAVQIDEFIIAGAFGTYLDVGSAVRVGMFPSLPVERFRQVGNAAGIGARRLLLSKAARQKAIHIAALCEYIELTTHPYFTEAYIKALNF